MIELLNCDNMDYMRTCKDKAFGLAIVDPPYGLNESKRHNYHPGAISTYKPKKWDNNVPTEDYFIELQRVSVHQIIWGGNYFNLPPNSKPIIWDKQQPEGIDQAMFEYAWSSQKNIQAKIFRRSPAADNNKVSNGDRRAMQERRRIHPTQKPVALYKWLLKNYAKPGWKIFDSHLGSGSIAIACHDYGYDLVGCELDKDYYDAAMKRLKQHQSQLSFV